MNKQGVKAVAVVVAGVMVAGFLLHQFSNIGVVAQARAGYTG